METPAHTPEFEPYPYPHGEFEISVMKEGAYREIRFMVPLKVTWYVTEKSTEDTREIAITLDQDMNFYLHFKKEAIMPYARMVGSTNEEIEAEITKLLNFDFMHAFFHIPEDPNYGMYHWALYGNYKHLTVAIEDYDAPDTNPTDNEPNLTRQANTYAKTASGIIAAIGNTHGLRFEEAAEMVEAYKKAYPAAWAALESLGEKAKTPQA